MIEDLDGPTDQAETKWIKLKTKQTYGMQENS